MHMNEGISFVVPVHNGATTIRDTLLAIAADIGADLQTEIVVVDDASRDGSADIVAELARTLPIRVIAGEGRGAAAALNAGIRAAHFSLIAQVDQDVVIRPGWTRTLTAALADPSIAAAQGWYAHDPSATVCVRAMALDLEERYVALLSTDRDTDHVCTGNTLYRASALHWIGLFDETLGYGYDNDVSYRLHEAGYRLCIQRQAESLHRWREGFSGYLRQQYGFGYGRVDLVNKHPWRFIGDRVSPASMMWHPLILATSLMLVLIGGLVAIFGGNWQTYVWSGSMFLALLLLERLAVGVRAYLRAGDAASLLFPGLHLARDFVWIVAIAVWTKRCVTGQPSLPSHSMRARAHSG
jgi:glycosyltransferase involved in cell wall biosynthesis